MSKPIRFTFVKTLQLHRGRLTKSEEFDLYRRMRSQPLTMIHRDPVVDSSQPQQKQQTRKK